MKQIENPLDWYPHKFWHWPEGDKKLVQVLEHVADIDYIMQFIPKTEVCVQAGAACGVWPYRFSQLFDTVLTFEPQPDNWEAFLANTEEVSNILARHQPLAETSGQKYKIHNDIHERENWGAGYCVEAADGLESIAIDDLNLDACDLIQLDIEGFELPALRGATETIQKFKPVIVLEEKPLNHMRGDHMAPRKWLERTFSYKKVGSIHKDVVIACE